MLRQSPSLHVFFVFAALLLVHSQQNASHPSGRLPLSKAKNGVDGWLTIESDPRMATETKRAEDGRTKDVSPPQDNQTQITLENAKLEIVDSRGRLVTSDSLERPLAKIESARLDFGNEIFLVTVDYSIDFGSYAGPVTSLLNIRDAKFVWLKATDADTHKEETVHLPKTLKADWKFVSVSGRKDILEVLCDPDFTGGGRDFVVTYIRYRFRNGEWIKYAKPEKAFWESDDGFPPSNKFRDK
jgi:hypothetical protein